MPIAFSPQHILPIRQWMLARMSVLCKSGGHKGALLRKTFVDMALQHPRKEDEHADTA